MERKVDQERKILVTGSAGQIGSELVFLLRKKFGDTNVVATGHSTKPSDSLLSSGPFELLDVCDTQAIVTVIKKYNIGTIYHLAALLSAVSEQKPDLAWQININGLKNVLDVARDYNLRVFWPSSIGAFGPTTPKQNTPQHTILEPTSMYGVTKVSGELMCNYYHKKWNVDVRGIRYPGIISSETLPGGGTTDYSVSIFYSALGKKEFDCYLREDTMLPMMYMPDALKAAVDLMSSPTAVPGMCYNLTAFSFTPKELAHQITKHISDFQIRYTVDPIRQGIADSWPDTILDTEAKNDWGWIPDFTLDGMIVDMLQKLKQKGITN